MRKPFLLLVLVSSLSLAGAQDKGKKPTPPPAAAPQPTELERTKLENLQLRMMLLNQEEQSIPERKNLLQQQYGDVVRQMEASHPGFIWNPTANALVPKPPAPKAAAPAEAPKK